MLLSICAECNSKSSTSIKEQKGSELLRKSGIKTLMSKIPFLGETLFLKGFITIEMTLIILVIIY